jgi:DNA primase small subunit
LNNKLIYIYISRAYQILEPLFEELILSEQGQNILSDQKQWKKLLQMIPDEEIKEKLDTKWSSTNCTSSYQVKWQELKDLIEKTLSRSMNKRSNVSFLKK